VELRLERIAAAYEGGVYGVEMLKERSAPLLARRKTLLADRSAQGEAVDQRWVWEALGGTPPEVFLEELREREAGIQLTFLHALYARVELARGTATFVHRAPGSDWTWRR